MNKNITKAIADAKANATEENVKALADLALPKFKRVYDRVTDAIKNVNATLTPDKDGKVAVLDRVVLATAIGLADEVKAYDEVADVITYLPQLKGIVKALADATTALADMRKTGTFKAIEVPAYLPDGKAVKAEVAIITAYVREAVENVEKHVKNGDFDPNTITVATALGLADDIAPLRAKVKELVTVATPYTKTLAQLDTLETAIKAIKDAKAYGFKTIAVITIPDYNA